MILVWFKNVYHYRLMLNSLTVHHDHLVWVPSRICGVRWRGLGLSSVPEIVMPFGLLYLMRGMKLLHLSVFCNHWLSPWRDKCNQWLSPRRDRYNQWLSPRRDKCNQWLSPRRDKYNQWLSPWRDKCNQWLSPWRDKCSQCFESMARQMQSVVESMARQMQSVVWVHGETNAVSGWSAGVVGFLSWRSLPGNSLLNG